jgi:hypothetical protein
MSKHGKKSKDGKKDRRIFKGRHAGHIKVVGASDGKHEDPKPAHEAKNCPQSTSSASATKGKQGLTHYVCNDCGTTWSK